MANQKLLTAFSALLVAFALAAAGRNPLNGQSRYSQYERSWTVPEGTVISMRMDSNLSSKTSRVGDKFTATVTIPVYVDGKTVIPAGSVVEGRVTEVTPAKRMSRSGTIAVAFDELVFPNGSRVRINGSLTSADPNERQRIDEESRVSGDIGNRKIVFIGGGGAIGAVLGAIAGGGKGAAVGGILGAGAGTAAILLSKGVEAEVRSGTPFGIQLAQPLVVRESFISEERLESNARASRSTQPESPESRRPELPLSSPEMIRRAQVALKDQGYYEGQVDGIMGPRTSEALRTYQREHNLPETGRLDQETARSLGIIGGSLSGSRSDPTATDVVLAHVLGASANRNLDGSIHVQIQTQANTGGWRWYEEHVVNGDTLEVFARAVRPTGIVTQVITQGQIDTTVQDGVENVTRVVVHGSNGNLSLPVRSASYNPPAPRIDISTARDLQRQAEALLRQYQNNLGISPSAGRGRYAEPEIQLLFAFNNFANAVRLYADIAPSLQDAESARAATLALAREARRTDKKFFAVTSPLAQNLTPRWDEIRQNVLRLMESQNIRTSEIEDN
jgi:peptidoglycan hydrolase-like protein with peptidoglycan-binding domain